MKKITILAILALMMATPVWATTDFGDTNGNLTADNDAGQTVILLQPSNKVVGNIVSSKTAISVVTKHENGTRNFAGSSTDTKIYWLTVDDANKGNDTMEVNLTASDTSEFLVADGWKPL